MSKSETSTAVAIDLNILLKFINKFEGDREKLNPFLNNCRNAINLANPSQKDILLKYILCQLEGRAESACAIRDFENWDQLENFLKSQFGDKKHYAALLSELQESKQSSNETVNQFALRIETCLSRLLAEINVTIPTTKKGELSGRVAAMQDLALFSFMTGLNPRISTVVRCRDPDTLNKAINFAVSEEKIYQSSIKRQYQNPGPSRPNINNNNNYTQRPSTSRSSNMNNASTNGFQRENGNRSVNFSNSNVICRYCKIPGHSIDQCRKREFNNRRFSDFNRQTPNQYSPSRRDFQGHNQPIHVVDSSAEDQVDDNLNGDIPSPGVVEEN